MGANSREFLLMRQNEEGDMYVPKFTKKEVQLKAVEDAEKLINEGVVDLMAVFTDISRVTEYVNVFSKKLRENITEDEFGSSYKANGAEISFRNTGDRLDYESDAMYLELKEKLKAREELLKLAYKSKDEIYDHEGVMVDKVPVKTFGLNALILKY